MAKQPKAELYAKELDGARLRGDWASEQPTQLHGGSGKQINWPELVRKYSKHNPERQTTANVAGAEQLLRSSLVHYWAEVGYTDQSHQDDYAIPNSNMASNGQTTFPPALSVEQNGIGWSGDTINGLVDRLRELSESAHNKIERMAVVPIQALALFSLGRDEDAVAILHEAKFLEEADPNSLKTGDHNEDYSVALMLMGFVVYGLANERLHVERPTAGYIPFALAGYARAIDLHEGVRGGKRANALRGLPADEIERWGETALYRNALITVREGDLPVGLDALRAYQAHAGRWPTDFRLPQRNAIYRTYLRALNRAVEDGRYVEPPVTPPKSQDDWRSQAFQQAVIANVASRLQIRDFEAERTHRHAAPLRAPGIGASKIETRTVSPRRPRPHRLIRPPSHMWANEMRTVQRAAGSVLEGSTSFPRAGRVNRGVLDFADLLVDGWKYNGEQGGDDAGDVVDILYRLTRLTFHSQRLARHLVVMLTAVESYDEARHALELYVQIVDKAKEADSAAAAGLEREAELREQATRDGNFAIEGNGETSDLSRDAEENAQEALVDSDSDSLYARTLVFGARMLYKYLHDAVRADHFAQKALTLVQAETSKNLRAHDKTLLPLVQRTAGTARAALAVQECDPLNRPTLQAEALALLKSSSELDPTASETFYELAFVQAETRDVTSAIFSVRKALELEPADVQSWHLLTLLLSAQKDYKGALRIAEVGLAEAEADDEADEAATAINGSGAANNGNGSAAAPRLSGIVNGSAAGAAEVGSGAAPVTFSARTLLLSVDFAPRPEERTEAIFRLMMTHNALEEIVEGVDFAIQGQRELFEFFHKRIASGLGVEAHQNAAARVAGSGQQYSSMSKAAHEHGRLSTFLHHPRDASTLSRRAGSVTGMGQSGATLTRSLSNTSSLASRQQRLSGAASSDSRQQTSAIAAPPAAALAPSSNGLNDDIETLSPSAERKARRAQYEAKLLAQLWLVSAASFRRAVKMDECRIAIQEAERIDPADPDVWVQLALWFAETEDSSLAITTLYKALACSGDHIAAAVHLARLFLSNPTLTPPPSYNTPAPKPRAEPQSTAMDGTRSRSIGGTPRTNDASPGGARSHFDSAAEAATSTTTQGLAAVSLAEGLLTSLTNTNGWDVPEAWLFLGRVAARTDRAARARECLKYALSLEETKPIRPLAVAIQRGL